MNNFDIEKTCKDARKASLQLANLDNKIKNKILNHAAQLIKNESTKIIAANAKDLENAKKNGLDAAKIDRLKLDLERINALSKSIKEIRG